MALAVQPPHPLHRNNLPRPRAGNDRVAGSLVDREAMKVAVTRQLWDRGMLSDDVRELLERAAED
jgi:hypothetical protein